VEDGVSAGAVEVAAIRGAYPLARDRDAAGSGDAG